MFCREQAVYICPYDKNHRICRDRIQRHLIKCEKNYPPGHLTICPFNATHRFPPSDLPGHLLQCPSKTLIEPERYNILGAKSFLPKRIYTSDDTKTISDCDEKWDEEYAPIYSNYVETRPLAFCPKTNDDDEATSKEFPEHLRRSRTNPLTLMVEDEDSSAREDLESITSYVSALAMGRGRSLKYMNAANIKAVFGRGKVMGSVIVSPGITKDATVASVAEDDTDVSIFDDLERESLAASVSSLTKESEHTLKNESILEGKSAGERGNWENRIAGLVDDTDVSTMDDAESLAPSVTSLTMGRGSFLKGNFVLDRKPTAGKGKPLECTAK